jgi:NADPH-dependent glutamate synthase beta subunit-like oxidoreductase/Pyruvate/2-oxoacid:ferredoxin oxidoreductase delta subunit
MQVDLERCIACGVCEETCPLSAITLQDKKALIESRIPPCIEACPVKTNAPMYINRIKEKDYEGAFRYISERNPFPSICSRVCHHPCESVCRRGRFDESLSIRELKRFVADRFALADKAPVLKKEEIAIVGAGPAGLSAAWSLAKKGYRPMIFEKEPKAGGWMRYGIPDYRLPQKVLDKEIDAILSFGINVNYGVAIGRDLSLDSLKISGFKAILIAVGSQKSKPLEIPGENLEGVLQGLNLLQAYHRGQRPEVKGDVLVIGGGNVAIDSARTALRLGASRVTILYRRGIEQMPADRMEIKEAQREGIKIKCLSSPVEFRRADGKRLEIICQEMILGESDETGRQRPLPKENSNFSLHADKVLCAVGQVSDLTFLEKTRQTSFNLKTMETDHPGIFVAGDVAAGPATVIEAIASGLRAAISIEQYLKGEKITGEWIFDSKGTKSPCGVYDYPLTSKRLSPTVLPVRKRKGNFDEADTGYSLRNASLEANRCWHCDLINDFPTFNDRCVLCNLCSVVCPTEAIPLSKETIEGTVQCESCPVGCQIREGFKGACQRYTNVEGRIETAAPLKFPERETLEEIRRNAVLSTPLVSAVGAGDSYPDFKPAPVQALEKIDGIDVVTVVTEAPLTYSSILLKIDTDKSIGSEGAPVMFRKRQVGHVTTEQYGSKIISLGGINLMKTDYNALLTRLMVNIANKEPFALEVEEGSRLELQVGETPIINGQPADRMKVACGAAIMGIFGNQLKTLADEIIILDYDITGLFSEGHVGQSLGFKYTGIRPPGKYGSPGRYFGTPGLGWGGTAIQDPLNAIQQYDKKKVWPGMKVVVLEVTGRHVAMLEANEEGDFHRIATPKEADEMRELIDTNSEPSLTSALYMGGCGGSARAGTTKNPIKLTQAVHGGRVKLTIGGVTAYVLPGGGINFMVDVGKMKWRSFTWVPVPAVVAPVEYTMEKSTFIEMGGHQQALRLLSDIKAEEAEKWKEKK